MVGALQPKMPENSDTENGFFPVPLDESETAPEAASKCSLCRKTFLCSHCRTDSNLWKALSAPAPPDPETKTDPVPETMVTQVTTVVALLFVIISIL